MALRALLPLLATALLVAAPAVTAHTAIYSADDQVRGSVGLLNEPVSTYAVTGLDVCFTENVTTSPRPAVNVGNPGAFTASLKAPDGSVHRADLEVPFGRPNCLTFADPLVLTQPGQYLVDLSGSINGTSFAVTGIKAGGEVLDRAALTFPDAGVASNLELAGQVAALQARLDAVEAAQASQDDEGKFAPGAPLVALLAVLVGIVALRRRA